MQLFFVGDSITLGVNDSERLGWPGRVCNRLDPQGSKLTAYNLGVRASTTVHIHDRWVPEVQNRVSRGTKNILIFSFGAADVANGVSLEQSLDNARSILWRADGEHRVLFVCPPPMSDAGRDAKVKELSGHFMKICRDLDIPCLDINYCLRQDASYLEELGRGDGVHPGAGGYESIADLVYDFLSPVVLPHLD